MSEVRLVVRDKDRDWSGTIHASCADRAIAALSADPVTLEELEGAVARFAKRTSPGRYFANLSPSLDDQPYDAGLVVLDLAARLVVVASTYSAPGRTGGVEYHDGRCCTDTPVRYHLADDWRFLDDGDHWLPVAEVRRVERAARGMLDAREVFYGQPLLEYIAREVFTAFARRDQIAAEFGAQRAELERQRLADESSPANEPGLAAELSNAQSSDDEEDVSDVWPGQEHDADPFYDTLSQIHAQWLLTPRGDLGGASPREIALDRRGHIDWDLQDRCDQWSRLGECPPGLAESTHAFRYGGFGTHELVKYYDLVRELLWSCWERLNELARSTLDASTLDALTVGDFLAAEVPRLEGVREAWLDQGDPEFHGRTPRSIIDRERARLPEAVSGDEAMIDPDCPCCQMMADDPGPVFWHLDGSEMDDDFAFDIYHRTREEWEQEQRDWEEHRLRFEAEQQERQRLGVATSSDDPQSPWSRSFSVGEAADVPLGVRIFGLGCRLAELIASLRGSAERDATPPEVQAHIDSLNRNFGNLRELLRGDDPSLAVALIDPVRDRFAEALQAVAAARDQLAPQCERLMAELERLLDEPPTEPTWESEGPDFPF